MPKGLFYIATGKTYVEEVIANVLCSQPFLGHLPVSLCTDQFLDNKYRDLFDQIICHPSPSFSYRDKVCALHLTPYEETLFLDSDAKLAYSPADLFELLKISVFAASPAPVRIPPGWCDKNVPTVFHEVNSGVLLFKKCSSTLSLFSQWIDLYDRLYINHNQTWDQASLRSVLWRMIDQNSLSFTYLPVEANLRSTKPWIVGRGSPAYIVHGRFKNTEWGPLLDYLNSDIDCFRSWDRWLSKFPATEIRPRFDRTYS